MTTFERSEVVVVGGGLIGLATARELLYRRPNLKLTVLEKESSLGVHQSGRNSGVIHAGLYYAPGSLKARLCREGRAALLRYADDRGIPYRICGKLVVARDEGELPRLDELRRRASENGLQDVRELGVAEFSELEPHVVGIRALHVPETGVIDFGRILAAYASDLRDAGGSIQLGAKVVATRRFGRGWRLETTSGAFDAKYVVICGGLQADRLAGRDSVGWTKHRIAPFRGDYFLLTGRSAGLVHGLVYPVPDPSFPFLGVHFTHRIDGQVWAGPNAVPALSREGYGRLKFSLRDTRDLLGFPGLWRLARRYWRTGGLELWRDINKRAAIAEMRTYLPDIEAGDVQFGPCGVRAQVIARDGSLVDDFLLVETEQALHVVNAPSPGATASLAIGRSLADQAMRMLAT